jgi:hypothetical protein
MRLTLRTLLAYLDDTLDAAEIKEIGEKVAESENAQKLINKLREVTRRRRLTAPPATGPEGTDPNDVAEYLDNELDSNKVSELEQLALDSEVHLAEIAACHQILTLVLGEPVPVPPKAKERMYALVQGREAIPYRKAQAPKKADMDATEEEEELSLSSGWLRWVLPAAGALLVVLLGLAIYQVLPEPRPNDNRLASNDKKTGEKENGERPADPKDKGGKDRDTDKGKETDKDKGKEKGKGKEKTNGTSPVNGGVAGSPSVVERASPPSKERVTAGTFAGGPSSLPTALVVRETGKDEWTRYSVATSVYTTDTLLALPGFTSIIRTKGGVTILMRGHHRDFTIAPVMDALTESVVTIHANSKFDLDLTLQRGRIFLANTKEKGPCSIRLRFESEVWDITLANPRDEVAVDLTRTYTPIINYRTEPPRAQCFLALIRGEADLRIDAFNTYNFEVEPPRWARMEWDSHSGRRGPMKEERLPVSLSKEPPSPDLLPEARRDALKRTQLALRDLEVLLSSPKSLRIALKETSEKADPAARVLAVLCLTAIDAIEPVIEILGSEDRNYFLDREAAFFALQRWVSRKAGQHRLLYDEKTETGLLIDKNYRKREAEAVVQLLHPFQVQDLTKIETYEALARGLQHRKIAIAEMAFWHLIWLSGGAKLPAGFNAALPVEDRERYAAQIQAMIEKRQLPAPPERPPASK